MLGYHLLALCELQLRTSAVLRRVVRSVELAKNVLAVAARGLTFRKQSALWITCIGCEFILRYLYTDRQTDRQELIPWCCNKS